MAGLGSEEDLGGLRLTSQPLCETRIQVKELVNLNFNPI